MPIKRRLFRKSQSSSRYLDKSGVGNKQNRFITTNYECNYINLPLDSKEIVKGQRPS